MFRDAEALRQLVRRWCPSSHTFFFAHGELTVTLEDIENHWLLPILDDQDPAEIELSPEELRIEAALADYMGGKNTSLGTQAARFTSWMDHFKREGDDSIRRAAFVAYWLSKCIFGEHPAYSIKLLYFFIAVKIAAGVYFPLAPLLLGQLYTQLDLLHAGELIGASCHTVATLLILLLCIHSFGNMLWITSQMVGNPMKVGTSLRTCRKEWLLMLVIFKEMCPSYFVGWVVSSMTII